MRLTAALLLLPAIAIADGDGDWASDPTDGASIYQDAGNPIKDESYAGDVVPRMEFRCDPDGDRPIAYIDWRRFISSFPTEVGFKVDDGKFTWLKWKVDGSEKVTMSPSADDTQRLIELMVGGKSLLVDVTPYSEGPVTVIYSLLGFTESIAMLKVACK